MSPYAHFIRRDLDMIASLILRVEIHMTGFHLVGGCAEEVGELARRLERLAAPRTADTSEPIPAEKVRDAA